MNIRNNVNVVEEGGQFGGGEGTDTRHNENVNYVNNYVSDGVERPGPPHGDIPDMSQRRWVEKIRSAGSNDTFERVVLD